MGRRGHRRRGHLCVKLAVCCSCCCCCHCCSCLFAWGVHWGVASEASQRVRSQTHRWRGVVAAGRGARGARDRGAVSESQRVIAGNRVGSPVGRRTAGPHVRMSHPHTRLVEGYPSLVLLSGLLYCFDVFFSLQSLTCKARIAAAAKTYHQVCGVILGRAACQCRCCCVQC